MSNDIHDERRWIQALERLGIDIVRIRLRDHRTGNSSGSDVSNIVESPPHPPRKFVEEWFNIKVDAERKYNLRWTVIGAIAAIIAAIPTITDFISWLIGKIK